GLDPRPQPAEGTLAPSLRRADGRVDWSWGATEIYDRWRGFQPWPGVHSRFRGQQLAILACRPLSEPSEGAPGELIERGGALCVRCGDGLLALERVRVEGRQPVSGADFARGARLQAGTDRLD
ncbi:MAG: methionyl-tRNA formyltransferase, partial [Terriglobales bacterium]